MTVTMPFSERGAAAAAVAIPAAATLTHCQRGSRRHSAPREISRAWTFPRSMPAGGGDLCGADDDSHHGHPEETVSGVALK